MADRGPPTDGAPLRGDLASHARPGLHADAGPVTEWRADWDAHAQRQRERLRNTSPAQRLAWLEEALEFAARLGAPPRRPDVPRR